MDGRIKSGHDVAVAVLGLAVLVAIAHVRWYR